MVLIFVEYCVLRLPWCVRLCIAIGCLCLTIPLDIGLWLWRRGFVSFILGVLVTFYFLTRMLPPPIVSHDSTMGDFRVVEVHGWLYWVCSQVFGVPAIEFSKDLLRQVGRIVRAVAHLLLLFCDFCNLYLDWT